MRLFISICLLFLLAPTIVFAEGDENKCHKSTEGTDFWFGFMENRWYHNQNHYLEITVTAREATTFQITIGPNENLFDDYSVGNNGSVQIEIPWSMVEAMNSEETQYKGIHLISDSPVNVYALNYDSNSADVAVIYPVESLGKEYYSMCYTPDVKIHSDGYAEGRNSEFMIVATEDSTTISITPSVVTNNNMPAGIAFTETLNKGEVYQVQSANNDYAGQGDLTGSHISSDKPVAFYSGNLATIIPNAPNMGGYDHLYEQIPPVQSWGREYFIVPLKTRNQDRYRVLASKDNTTISIPGIGSRTMNQGEFYEFTLNSNQPTRLVADKSVMVAQFSQSSRSDNRNGDPFMIILSPSSQSKKDVTFVTYNSEPIKNFYVNIITLTSEIKNLELSGNYGNIPIQNQFSSFPNTNYSYAQVTINDGTYRLRNSSTEKGFLAYVYGFGNYESYGYGVGFNLDLVLDIGQNINFEGDTLNMCYGENRTLDAGYWFDTYEWSTTDSIQSIKVTEEGLYWRHTTTDDGCDLYDSIYVKVNRPEIQNRLDDASGCYPYTFEFEAENGFNDYLWQNQDYDILSNTQKLTASESGNYYLTVYDALRCSDRDTVQLTVFEVPEIEIIADTLICGGKTTSVNALLKNADPSLWDFEGSIFWSTDQPGKLSFSGNGNVQTEVTVNEWGKYEVYFELTTIDGCVINDSIRIRFHPNPTSIFEFENDEKCEGYSKKLLFTGSATDSAFFFWDLDGCIFVDTIDWKTYSLSVGAFLDKPPYIQLFIDDNGCVSDTFTKALGAKPNFKMDADFTRGCDQLNVNFTSELLTEDNVNFEWEFHDGETINKQNATKYYPTVGFYEVSLAITNPVTQCKNGFTLDSMIKVFPTPVPEINLDPDNCYSDSIWALHINSIDSTNYTWIFSGAHQAGGANDSIRVVIDSAMGKVSLLVNEYGCLSDTITKQIKRNPHFDFYTVDEEGCQPYYPEIFSSTSDDSLEFTWIHDTLPNITAISDFYFFSEPGKKTIGLIAYSNETHCSDTLVKTDWITVHPKPYAAFEVNYPVATIENPDISFSNLSGLAEKYFWDFEDTYTSNLENPMHSYSDIGEYNVNMIAESDFGCLDTSEFLVQIVPFSVFTPNAFRPESDIPENRFFMPIGIGADPERFNIKIYTRWGTLVFESNNPVHKWDGKTLNGEPAPMGNYIWESNFYDIQGIEHKQNGYVILIR